MVSLLGSIGKLNRYTYGIGRSMNMSIGMRMLSTAQIDPDPSSANDVPLYLFFFQGGKWMWKENKLMSEWETNK